MQSVKVVGYKRVSTELQREVGYSLEYQQREIIKYCKDNHLELVEVYGDEAKSGTKAFAASPGEQEPEVVFRPGLVAMLDRLKQGDIAFVVVLATNRLWRSQEANLLICGRLKRLGVGVK